MPSWGLVTLLVLKTSVCALLIKGEHFLQHSVAQPVLLRHADAIEDPQYQHCQNITNTYKYRLYRLPEHQSSLLWKRNDDCLKNKSRQYVLEVGPAGSHRAAVMKVELLCNNLWIQYVELTIGPELGEFNKFTLGEKMFDRGVSLRSKWVVWNVNVHLGGLGESADAVASLKNASHLKWRNPKQA